MSNWIRRTEDEMKAELLSRGVAPDQIDETLRYIKEQRKVDGARPFVGDYRTIIKEGADYTVEGDVWIITSSYGSEDK
jgi:hypothetical protein